MIIECGIKLAFMQHVAGPVAAERAPMSFRSATSQWRVRSRRPEPVERLWFEIGAPIRHHDFAGPTKSLITKSQLVGNAGRRHLVPVGRSSSATYRGKCIVS